MREILCLVFSVLLSFSAAAGSGSGSAVVAEEASESAEELFEEEIIEEDYDDDYYKDEDASYVICSVEAINASLGYLVEPVKVELTEGESCAEIMVDLLEEYGYEPEYSGSFEKNFYLTSIGGVASEDACIPNALLPFLEDNYIVVTDKISHEGALGQFDLSEGAGWIYTVNGEMPSVAMCDYFPEENDVIRLRFCLAYGGDTGYYYEWGFEYGDLAIADLEEITAVIAECGAEAFEEYFDIIADFDTPQDEIDTIMSVVTK